MAKIFNVYLAKADTPYSEAYADLDLPAAPYELSDALEKLRMNEGEAPYLQINEYYDFEELSPLFSGDAGFHEFNALAQKLSELDDRQRTAFDGLVKMELQKKDGPIAIPRFIDLAYSANCCHVLYEAKNDAELGRFYAENSFVSEVDDLPDNLFELLDFEKIGRNTRLGEGGVFTEEGYVTQHSEIMEAYKTLDLTPKQPDYQILLELTGECHNYLKLPDEPQAFDGLTDCPFRCLDCHIPQMKGIVEKCGDLAELNSFALRLSDLTEYGAIHYKAALAATDCDDLRSAQWVLDNLDHFMLDGKIASPEDMAMSELRFIADDDNAERLAKYMNLPAYGRELLERDNAVITPYGHVARDDYAPMMAPFPEQQQNGMEMTL